MKALQPLLDPDVHAAGIELKKAKGEAVCARSASAVPVLQVFASPIRADRPSSRLSANIIADQEDAEGEERRREQGGHPAQPAGTSTAAQQQGNTAKPRLRSSHGPLRSDCPRTRSPCPRAVLSPSSSILLHCSNSHLCALSDAAIFGAILSACLLLATDSKQRAAGEIAVARQRSRGPTVTALVSLPSRSRRQLRLTASG